MDASRHLPDPPWADTQPALYRSEAFAEDLPEAPPPVPALPQWPPMSSRRGDDGVMNARNNLGARAGWRPGLRGGDLGRPAP